MATTEQLIQMIGEFANSESWGLQHYQPATRAVLDHSKAVTNILNTVDPSILGVRDISLLVRDTIPGEYWAKKKIGGSRGDVAVLIAAAMTKLLIEERKVRPAKQKPKGATPRPGRPRDSQVAERVTILHRAGIKLPLDLRDSKKLRNAFGALEHAKLIIPGFDTHDWMNVLSDSSRSEELKKVKESLRLNLIRKTR